MIDVVNKFNTVDMGGIDIVESQGATVDGLFTRLLNAIQNCRYQILYNWKFAKIEIAPSYVELVFDGTRIYINEAVSVTEDDVVHIYSLEPGPAEPVIEALTVSENGTYEPRPGVDGYSPVIVNVSSPVPVAAKVPNSTSGPSGTRGTWTASSGYDGYYITENIADGYFLLEYAEVFKLYSIEMVSTPINGSTWIFIFEYHDAQSEEWISVYESQERESPRSFSINVDSYPTVDAIRWRTTTTKVAPYNIRIPEFYALGF